MDTGWKDDRLFGLIDRALDALSIDRERIRLTVEGEAGRTRVALQDLRLDFEADEHSRTLAWERLVDALPLAVERVRLAAMHRATGEQWGAPWSIYSTATAIAWLVHYSGGFNTPRWSDAQMAIVRAAEEDGGVAFRFQTNNHPSLHGHLRSRQFLAKIQFDPELAYSSADRTVTARDVLPHTVADISADWNLADIVEFPWVRDANVMIDSATLNPAGTTLNLREALLPLVPIPQVAHDAAPAGGPRYAPWIVTATERAALDAIDKEAHGLT